MPKRIRTRVPKHEWIDPAPFAALINARCARYLEEAGGTLANVPDGMGPAGRICDDFGWGYTENSQRRLYRYRYQITDTKVNGLRVVKKAQGISRTVVEDALHAAGIDFYDLYPEYAHERSGPLAPEAWCPSCQEHVMLERVRQGATGHRFRCIWCKWAMSKGHLNEHGVAA